MSDPVCFSQFVMCISAVLYPFQVFFDKEVFAAKVRAVTIDVGTPRNYFVEYPPYLEYFTLVTCVNDFKVEWLNQLVLI